MALTPQQTARLAELDAKLASGVRAAQSGAERVEYDLDALRQERAALRQLAAGTGAGARFRSVRLA